MRGVKRLRRARMALARRVAGPHAHVSIRPSGRERRVFLIRGAPRSGTNWAANLLNLHPKVIADGEFHLENFLDVANNHVSVEHHATSKEPIKGELLAGIDDLIERTIRAGLALRPGAEWIGDRTPRRVRELVPGAPVIWLCRDGRDVLVSWVHHLLRTGDPRLGGEKRMRTAFGDDYEALKADPGLFKQHPEKLLGDETLVRELTSDWSTQVTRDLETLARLEKDGRVLKVRYEDLLADTESARTQMYTFLGVDPHEAKAIDSGDRTAAGFKQNADSFFRKGEAGDWKNYFLTSETDRWFTEEAGDALAALGYQPIKQR